MFLVFYSAVKSLALNKKKEEERKSHSLTKTTCQGYLEIPFVYHEGVLFWMVAAFSSFSAAH